MERDPNLEATLREERDGILAWMIQGTLNWQVHGLSLSPTIKAESGAYRKDSDLLGEFLENETELSPSERAEQGELFLQWKGWCNLNGLQQGYKAAFSRKLSDRGHGESRYNGRRYYQGLKIRKKVEP
jgi:putative DNA primase/helicase